MHGFLGWTTDHFARWVLKPEYLPAWLQAGAAGVALLLSWLAIRGPAMRESRNLRTEERAIAVAIYPEIQMLVVDSSRARDKLQHTLSIQSQLITGQAVANQIHVDGFINDLPMLDRNLGRVHILGEAVGPKCANLFRMANDYRGRLQNLVNRVLSVGGADWRAALQDFFPYLDDLKREAEACERLLKPIYDDFAGT